MATVFLVQLNFHLSRYVEISKWFVRRIGGLTTRQVLGPGAHMPLDYLSVCCHLTKLKRQISNALYAKHEDSASSLPVPSAFDCIRSLRDYFVSIPSHLNDYKHVAALHSRSVAVLHLRYWSTVIFATRPFLLYSVLHGSRLSDAAKRKCFEELSSACTEAAAQSLEILRHMLDQHLLSSLVTFDCGCVLEDMQVSLLALAKYGHSIHKEHVKFCLNILQSMDQIFWTRHALTEVVAQLEENDLLNADQSFSPDDETFCQILLDGGSQNNL